MSDDSETPEPKEPMFPGDWHIERKPTIEMRVKKFLSSRFGRR